MKFPDQVQYLYGIGKRLGLNTGDPKWYKALADLVGHNSETVRKWVGGYQAMPEKHKKAFDIAVKHRDLQQPGRPSQREIVEAYGFMPWTGLLEGFANLVSIFKRAPVEKQKQLYLHLEAMLSEIDKRLRSGDVDPGIKTAPANIEEPIETAKKLMSEEEQSAKGGSRK